jgi:hypothetical protein
MRKNLGSIPSNVRFRMIASIDSSLASWFAYTHAISESSERNIHHVTCKQGLPPTCRNAAGWTKRPSSTQAVKTTHEHFFLPPSSFPLYWSRRAGRRGEPLVDPFCFGTFGFEGGIDGREAVGEHGLAMDPPG